MDEGHEIPIAVNLSTRCLLDPSFPDLVERLLAEHEVPPSLLRLEITESAVMGDPARATDALRRLHDHGVSLSIDDFGTGYTSMAYLRRLPVDELKVDRSFVMSMTENEHDAVLVRTAIDLGHNLGLTVVAEGVERADHVVRAAGARLRRRPGLPLRPPDAGGRRERAVRAARRSAPNRARAGSPPRRARARRG